ncbi:hypothetical protein T310_3488 [Rasamsonia emersonii CBS 393.64]|uniref:Nephrocystin 3-like N-terminal domain-containing protein n=1 Tax=Rasamsonia emersonii (strain ATCC 16479 / CBS 393.64 / IMI 116815) TaxID=1408163 RepID=A0A0F4YWL0_RASE3|nr:hypothetical protein T310_3488 [Rasamsonia emersonii CBS 393.64]KKA22490.1 hypothetical protein T310_3488 [Rasamsonia emersonii CBS 393.64]
MQDAEINRLWGESHFDLRAGRLYLQLAGSVLFVSDDATIPPDESVHRQEPGNLGRLSCPFQSTDGAGEDTSLELNDAHLFTFIDFSWKVITGAYEVYKSPNGTTSENACISTILADLQEATEGLISDVEGKTKHKKALIVLADNCHDLSQDFSKILEKLKATEKNSKWQSLKVKLASMRKEKEIASIEKRLDSYRSQILLRVNFILWYESAAVCIHLLLTLNDSERQSSTKTQLDRMENEGLQMRTESASQLAGLRKELGKAIQKLLKEQKEDAETRQINEAEQIKLLTEIRSSLSRLQSMTTSMSRENRVLRRLYFKSMNSREDNITDAEKGTFRWFLEDRSDCAASVTGENDDEEPVMRQRTRHSFLKWLNSGGQIFYISGKAGSGKSTLLKFLFQHSRVRRELEDWACDKKLVFANFFFWNSVDKLTDVT